MKLKTREAEADLEEVSASCGHFSFSLLEFGPSSEETNLAASVFLDHCQTFSHDQVRPLGRSSTPRIRRAAPRDAFHFR
jgi:hypothetical protein